MEGEEKEAAKEREKKPPGKIGCRRQKKMAMRNYEDWKGKKRERDMKAA